ncbi:uncharacterized protein isoform X3 [Rhodnius prolixus]|uniref:uncharacterized protein isoform X3 n=1 Tax=Rhodnius prolixus TaxID=13249 RepID=UPI003D18B2DA
MDFFLFLIYVNCILINAGPGRSDTPDCHCDSPNVRTVLFKSSDISKECWSREELALLYARRLMQEILPRKVPNNINLLMDYIKMCLKTLQEEVTSKHAHKILLSAMTDTLGGYLQAYGFPIAKEKNYEGEVNYCVTKQMNELLETTKQVLATDGGSWTRPVYVKKSSNIAPFVVPTPTVDNACSSLISSYDMTTDHAMDTTSKPCLHIPLPFLDSAAHPCAIALPFRNRSLYSLISKDSANILLRYYTAAIHCLYRPAEETPGVQPQCNIVRDDPAVHQFNVDFHNWLVKVVLPHLRDEKWYAGFGSVWRLIETMTKKGIKTVEDSPGKCFSVAVAEQNEGRQTSIWFYILCVMIIILLFWLCVCCICACARACRKRSSSTLCSCPTSSSSGQVVNALLTLYEGSQEIKYPTNVRIQNKTYRRPGSFCSNDGSYRCSSFSERFRK